MFSADLSWKEPDVEKVGERRERKARERSNPSSVHKAPSIKSSKSSISDDRQLFWPASLKKAKSTMPKTKPRPSTARSPNHVRKQSTSSFLPRPLDVDCPLKDPILQPAWTYSGSLSPTLPSGAPLDLPVHEIPELDGDMYSSRTRTNSCTSRSSHDRPWGWKAPAKIKVIDEVYHEVQQLSPKSFIARTTRRSSEAADSDGDSSPKSSRPLSDSKSSYSVKIEGCLDLEALKLQDTLVDIEPVAAEEQPSYSSTLPQLVAWRPPTNWDIILPTNIPDSTEPKEPREKIQQKKLPPIPMGSTVTENGTFELTRFQRFIRRMENAGSKVILDRLKEDWNDPEGEEADEEFALEKSLWVLTAFQLQNLGRSTRDIPKPRCSTGKILELYGDLSELYQLSAMHPKQKVHYITTQPQRANPPLPGNVTYLTVPQAGIVPFPFVDSSFSHIRASTLPSLVPSAKLPQLLRECYRLLAPGGMLEIRIMDASPVRKTAGPKFRGWIEDRLSLNLERLFRCSKPCMLVPSWLVDAGFDLPGDQDQYGQQNMMLPCAYEEESSNVDAELSTLVGRSIWKGIWGEFVDNAPGEARWWWQDEEIMQECLEYKTVFECGSICAFKS